MFALKKCVRALETSTSPSILERSLDFSYKKKRRKDFSRVYLIEFSSHEKMKKREREREREGGGERDLLFL